MPKKREDNLRSLGDRPLEERREIARKGNAASVAKRREKASLRKALQDFLEHDSGVIDKASGKTLTGTELMVGVAVKEMMRGNPRFWEIIRDTAGEKPVERVMVSEVSQSVIDEVERAVLED